MADVAYERPLPQRLDLPQRREVQYEPTSARDREPPRPQKTTGDYLTEGALATTAGAGMTGGAWALRGILRKLFPGTPGLSDVAVLKRLHGAIVKDDATSSLTNEYEGYKRMAANSERPLTFFDYMATRDGLPSAKGVMQEFAKNAKNKPVNEALLGDRIGDAQKQRILASLADGLGVDQKSLGQSVSQLIKQRSEAAAPLYAEAFKDKRPIRDTKLLDLFGTDTPNMAMMHALKARMKTLGLQGREPPSLFAADPSRKDAWQRLLTSEVPEHMFTGQDWAKMREFYAPAVEDLHEMRRHLWTKREEAKRTGNDPDAKAYQDAWANLTNYLDQHTSGAYKTARQQFKGDSDLLAAHGLGGELLKKKPDEVREALAKMGPDERQALSQGFYGSMNDLDTTRFLREFAARPERYADRNAILGAVFPDKRKLGTFLEQMKGETAMQDSAALLGRPSPGGDSQPRYPYLRLSGNVTGDAHMTALESLRGLVGWPSRRASTAGMRFGMREAHPIPDPAGGGGYNWVMPDSARVADTPLAPLEQARAGARWAGAGALGGLGAYAGQQATGWEPSWLGQPRP